MNQDTITAIDELHLGLETPIILIAISEQDLLGTAEPDEVKPQSPMHQFYEAATDFVRRLRLIAFMPQLDSTVGVAMIDLQADHACISLLSDHSKGYRHNEGIT